MILNFFSINYSAVRRVISFIWNFLILRLHFSSRTGSPFDYSSLVQGEFGPRFPSSCSSSSAPVSYDWAVFPFCHVCESSREESVSCTAGTSFCRERIFGLRLTAVNGHLKFARATAQLLFFGPFPHSTSTFCSWQGCIFCL